MSRRILTFSLFEAARTAGLTQEQKAFLKRYTSGTWKYNPATGLVDVDGDFNCDDLGLSDFKEVRFGVVGGSFYCNNNQLTSLEGAPRKVGEYFYCEHNQLTSLKGAPQKVGQVFSCGDNRLTTLEGAPQKVGGGFFGGGFNCNDNNLTTLEGGPQEVGGHFYCEHNQLTSLEGAPQKVGGGFHCGDNSLTTLEGAPQVVGGRFDCSNNNLTSLKGAPQKVGWIFDCGNNQLTSLEGGPGKIGGYLYCGCGDNPVSEETIKRIFDIVLVNDSKSYTTSYMEAVETIWDEIPVEDQALLYRPEFEWVGFKGFLPPEALNQEIQKDPAGMAITLKEVWNDKWFKETRDQLVWPKGYEKEAHLLGDLDDVGF